MPPYIVGGTSHFRARFLQGLLTLPGGWRCERKSGQTKPSLKAVAAPLPRASRRSDKYGPIVAAARRDGADFSHFFVYRR